MTFPPSLSSPTPSTSSFTAATTSVPPAAPSASVSLPVRDSPIETLALPLANGATPVSTAIGRKSSGERSSARNGGAERRDDLMYVTAKSSNRLLADEKLCCVPK